MYASMKAHTCASFGCFDGGYAPKPLANARSPKKEKAAIEV